MASWAAFVTSTLAKLGFTTTLHERTLNAAKMDYTGDTNLQTGMLRLVRAGSNTVYIEEWNGSGWAAQRWVNSSIADLNADMVTSGTFNVARIPTITDGVHGARGGGDRHSIATSGSHGFMASSDRVKMDALRIVTFLDAGAPSMLDVRSVSTESAWESYGPTGSGANNIWSAIPAAATAIYVRFRLSGLIFAGATSSNFASVRVHHRNYGSSAATSNDNAIALIESTKVNGQQFSVQTTAAVWIPLNSSRFDLAWSQANILNDSGGVSVEMTLLGYSTAT